MEKNEFDELVESTYPDIAGNFDKNVLVIPVTDNLLKVIKSGIDVLRKSAEG